MLDMSENLGVRRFVRLGGTEGSEGRKDPLAGNTCMSSNFR
jgi:hypothetical protein